MSQGQQWFPGLAPASQDSRPRKIIVTRAAPETIEEKEGMFNDNIHNPEEWASGGRSVPPPAPQPSPESVQEKQEDKNGGTRRANVYFVKIASTLLAALASLMSWHYSFEWSKDKLPGFWRYILPVIVVGCSVLLPQVAIIFIGRKGVRGKMAAVLVFCVGLLASGFSMVSTITRVYNVNSENINKKAAAITSAQSDADARAELVRIDAEINRLNKEIDSTQLKVDAIAVEDTLKGDSQALMRRLNSAKKDKVAYEGRRAEAQKRIDQARALGYTAATVREDFNAFLGRQLGTDPGKVEFAIASAPAILIDVVAPILSAVALFL